MHHRSRIKHFLLPILLFTTLLPISICAAEADPGSPGEQLNSLLASLETIGASFSQVTRDINNRTLQENRGQLWFEGPASFLIETAAPSAQTLVSDGARFWSYDEDLMQVVIRDLEHDIQQVPILLLGGDTGKVTDDFDVSYFQDEQVEYYLLVPTGPNSLFESLAIEFLAHKPFAIAITDGLGQHTRIELHEVVVNEPIDPARFVFQTPPGVDVIDDRAVTDES